MAASEKARKQALNEPNPGVVTKADVANFIAAGKTMIDDLNKKMIPADAKREQLSNFQVL